MKTLLISVLTLLSLQVSAQTNFTQSETWREVISRAKKEGKMILVSVNKNDCKRCVEMDSVFQIEEVAGFYNKNFINLKASKVGDKGDDFFVETFGIVNFPSYLIFNKKGEMVHRRAGGQVVEGMLNFAKGALDPKSQFMYLTNEKNYEKYKTDLEFRRKRLLALANNTIGDLDPKEIDSYFNLIPKEEWSDSANWKTFNYVGNNIESKTTQYFLKNIEEFAEKNNASHVYTTGGVIIFIGNMNAMFDKEKRDLLVEATENTFFSYKTKEEQFQKLEEEGNWKRYKSMAKELMRNPLYHKDGGLLNHVAWKIFNYNKTDKENLNLARQLAQLANKAESNAAYLDTLAQILYFSGDKNEAIRLQEAAVAKSDELETKNEMREVLEAMKNDTLN
jgi:hypothetical protein